MARQNQLVLTVLVEEVMEESSGSGPADIYLCYQENKPQSDFLLTCRLPAVPDLSTDPTPVGPVWGRNQMLKHLN